MRFDTSHYYGKLLINRIALGKLLQQRQLFKAVPADWYVIITDIRNSTLAVFDGLHENVNRVATASIVAVLNIAFKEKITIPFFFGGDGATFLIPPAIKEKVLAALIIFKENTLSNFDFDLRVGIVSLEEIYESGNTISISRYGISEYFSIPVILGGGLAYAEKIIKGDDYLLSSNTKEEELDLTGMQCRWDKIPPPDETNEIITLLVVAMPDADQAGAFSKVIHLIDSIYGPQESRQPISVPKLRLNTTFNRMRLEMHVRLGKIKALRLLANWLVNIIGYFYLKSSKGQTYLDLLVKMSDTLVLDGKINTVISGTEEDRIRLTTALDQLERENLIIYGVHVSAASIMSCYVRDMKDGHIHFVDGAGGGYTMAAKVLKSKVSNMNK